MITTIYTYFGQKEMLPKILKEGIKLIIVDDCSPKPLEKQDGAECYRIIDDIRWNCTGAKNLGFTMASGWIINSDIDHIITKELVDKLEKMPKDKNTVYILGREFSDGSKDVYPSRNVYLIHKSVWEKVGGFDEDFAGNYGYEDILFMDMCSKNATVKEIRDYKCKLDFGGESKLSRDSFINEKLYREKSKNKKNNGKILRFKWIKL